jgi:antitoxin component HigA of HigAB toxin-antitoxin module
MALRLTTKNDSNSSDMDEILRGRRSMTVDEFRALARDETVT